VDIADFNGDAGPDTRRRDETAAWDGWKGVSRS